MKNYGNAGFTLIEIVAVLIIISVVISVAIKKVDMVSYNAHRQAIVAGVKELNVRETLNYFDQRIAGEYVDDDTLHAAIDYDLGEYYSWTAGPTPTGGTLQFKELSLSLYRRKSTILKNSQWELQ